VLSIVTVICLFAAALGPATDADSLDYHLAVPLDWLRHGGAYPRPEWFTARLVGLGESLNMLGLAAGTDGLGAAFQAAGLVIALLSVTLFAKTQADQLFAVLLVVACPLMATLITAQKAQLLPAAALTVALVIVVQHFKTFNLPIALLAFSCAAFAVACKHSYLLTASVVVFVGLLAAIQAQRFRLSLLVLGCCFTVLAVPIFARNFFFYGDPISPFLERWRPSSDPALIAFADILRNSGGDRSIGRLGSLPWELAVTLNPRRLHDVLGLGVLGFLLLLRERGLTRQLLLSALAAFALVVALGQLQPRFFLEPYLWCAAAAAAAPWHPLKSFLFKALIAQGFLVFITLVYIGSLIFPGALTLMGRDRVMTLMAPGYAEAKWLNATLPPDAVMLEEFRYRALLPRPFITGDRFVADPFLSKDYNPKYRFTDASKWQQQLTEFVKEKHVTVLVTKYPIKNPAYAWLATHYGTQLDGPAQFHRAARSPFNRGLLMDMILTRLSVNVSTFQPEVVAR
jgi:hypothetical protein